jgi:molecular chaperone GrpE
MNEPPVNEANAAEAQAEMQDGQNPAPEQTPPEKPSASMNDRIKAEMAELMEQAAQAQDYLLGWQRERAEFANYKRRIEQQQKDSYANASGDVLKKLIPVIDDFDRALGSIPDDIKTNPWVSGTSMIQRKMTKILDDFGVTVIDPAGQLFDPNLHEAVTTQESDQESGTVLEVLQKGYQMGDRLLRPALVKVAR